MKSKNVQNSVFGERKDFETGQNDSSFGFASKSVRGLNADDVTFGVFRTSNKSLGIKAGENCGPVDGPNWRQGMLSVSALDNWTDEAPVPNLAQDSVSQQMQVAKPKVWSNNQKGRKARRKEALKTCTNKDKTKSFQSVQASLMSLCQKLMAKARNRTWQNMPKMFKNHHVLNH